MDLKEILTRAEGPPSHEGGIRELFKARNADTGQLYTVFTMPDVKRPLISLTPDFESKNKKLETVEEKRVVVGSRNPDDGVGWECRKCRSMISSKKKRFSVEDGLRNSLGEWCEDCVDAGKLV